MPEKKTKVKLDLKNLAMLPSYFDYIFVHLKQKVRLRPELSPKFLSILAPNPARTRSEKPGPTHNSDSHTSTRPAQKKAKILSTLRLTKRTRCKSGLVIHFKITCELVHRCTLQLK